MADTIHPTTAAEAATEVRALLNESAAAFWSDAEITNWISEACVDISSITGCYESNLEVTLVSAQRDYTTAGNANIPFIINIDSVLYNKTKGLIKINPRQVGKQATPETTAGDEWYWWWFAKSISIMPIPDATSAGKKIEIFCSLITETWDNIPDSFQALTIPFAVSKALIKDRKYAASAQVMGIYINWLQAKMGFSLGKNPDTAEMYKLLENAVKTP